MDEQKRAAGIRAAVRGLTTRGRGRRYPTELRRQALAYVTLRRAQGATLRAAAREVELPWRTVEHWIQDRKASAAVRKAPVVPKPSAAILRPVTVAPADAVTKTFVVHGPRGLRIEGLDIGQLAELCARLA